MIYVLLGMHKSGTTMLSKILHDSEIGMGNFAPDKEYDEGNKFERAESRDFNIKVLGCDPAAHSLNISNVLTDVRSIDPQTMNEIKNFVKITDSEERTWGFKDPRTCLTYNIWKEILPAHKIIAIYRHPYELWEHYRRQTGRQIHMYFSVCWKTIFTWYVYNLEILKILKETKAPFFMAEYSDFMTRDNGLKKLRAFTGLELNDSRDSKLYRSKKHFCPLFASAVWIQKTFFGRDVMKLYRELGKYANAE